MRNTGTREGSGTTLTAGSRKLSVPPQADTIPSRRHRGKKMTYSLKAGQEGRTSEEAGKTVMAKSWKP